MRQQGYQRGFILSIEAVLLFTIVGIGLMVGLSVLRDALIKYHFSQQDGRFFVADSSDPPIMIGNVAGFDEHDAPLVVFVDYHDDIDNPLPGASNFRTLVGVRDNRLTTRQALFYADVACTGPIVCVASAGSEAAHDLVATLSGTTGGISYLNALQGGGPSYAIGRDLGQSATQDLLYRSTPTQCDVELVAMWVSQTIASAVTDSCIPLSPGISGSDLSLFQLAEPVLRPGGTANVLQGLVAPYFINMIGNPLQEFSSIPPSGEQ